MLRAFAVVLTLAGSAAAQPLRFQFAKGETLDYRVTQTTRVTETTVDEKGMNPTTGVVDTALALTKRWTVRDVDAAGVATLELSVTAMRQTTKLPDGTTHAVDSANAEDAKQMAQYLNKPVLAVRVDARGQVIEVKDAQPGAAARVETELPFRVVLADGVPAADQPWTRAFAFTLNPPHGTGEKYDATQTYRWKGAKDGLAVIGVETALKDPPKTAGERVPLVPQLWTGEVYVNTAAGRYHAARLTAKADLANHQGEGTRFVFESVYAEDAVK